MFFNIYQVSGVSSHQYVFNMSTEYYRILYIPIIKDTYTIIQLVHLGTEVERLQYIPGPEQAAIMNHEL